MCVCMYIYIYECMYMSFSVYTDSRKVHIRMLVSVALQVCMYACVCIYIYIYMNVWMYMSFSVFRTDSHGAFIHATMRTQL